MIEVKITSQGGNLELGYMRIENTETSLDPGYGDYSVQYGVDTAEGFAVYQRPIYLFPRQEINVLGLIRLALEALDEKELSLDGNPDQSTTSPDDARRARNLARELGGSM